MSLTNRIKTTLITPAVTIAIIAAAVVLMLDRNASATSIVPRQFSQLCDRADLIFCGTVSAIRSTVATQGNDTAHSNDTAHDIDTDDNRIIHTYTTFTNVNVIQGQTPNNEIVIRTLGGEAGGERLVVDGMPTFEVGQRYVLFVRGNNQNICPIVGWRQGCFHAVETGDGQSIVKDYRGRAVSHLAHGRLQFAKETHPNGPPQPAMTLDEFLATISATTTENTTNTAQPTADPSTAGGANTAQPNDPPSDGGGQE
jgi:hypothetical protein